LFSPEETAAEAGSPIDRPPSTIAQSTRVVSPHATNAGIARNGRAWQTATASTADQGMPMPSTLSDLWAGHLPLPRAFWHFMIFWGFLINLGATIASLAVLVAVGGGAPPAWAGAVSVALHLLPVPYNIACLVGVWRSAGRPEVEPTPRLLTRGAAVAWTFVMLLI
jgi:hypothetical protein